MAIYYLDGTTLLNSSAAFTDAGLTTCAADGFYSDGVSSRELSGCAFLPSQTCGSCATPCGTSVISNPFSDAPGVYKIDIDSGSSTGAVILKFDPASVPDGIRVTYNSQVYNKLSSPVDGYHASTNAANVTYIGASASDCGLSGSTYTLNEYFYGGGAFAATGATESVTVAAGDVSTSSSAPGNCVMVIPKANTSPSTMNIEIVGACSTSDWGIEVNCPSPLTSLLSNANSQESSGLACSEPLVSTYYHAPVNESSTPGNINIHDWMFIDANGGTTLGSGWYSLADGTTFQVANGVIIATGTCPTYELVDCVTGVTVTVSASGSFSPGDVISYRLLDPSTGLPTGDELCGTLLGAGSTSPNAVIIFQQVRTGCDAVQCPQP